MSKTNIKALLKEHWLIIIIIALFFLSRLFFLLTRYHLPVWDESVYLGMGKYLYSGGSSGLLEYIRPIGLPLITGLFWFLGLNQILFSGLTAIIFSSALICITYAVALKIFSRKTALLSAFLLAITPIFFYYSGSVMTEIPSTFFMMLAIYLFIYKKNFWAGISSGLAFIFRFPQGLIMACILLVMVLQLFLDMKERKNVGAKSKIGFRNKIRFRSKIRFRESIFDMLRHISGFIIMIVPLLLYDIISYAKYYHNLLNAMLQPFIAASMHQSNIIDSVITDGSIPSRIYGLSYYLLMLIKNNPLLIIFIITIIYYFARRQYKDFKMNAIYIPMIIFLGYLTFIINKQERFLITILPLVCMAAAYLVIHLYDKSRDRDMYKVLFYGIILIIAITSVYAIAIDRSYYNWQPSINDESPIVNGLYKYFDSNKIDGIILTTDPVFSAYSDKRFIPYYDTVKDDRFINEWEKNYDFSAVVYSDAAFPCQKDDEKCLAARKAQFNEISSKYYLVYNSTFKETYYDYPVYIFVKRSS